MGLTSPPSALSTGWSLRQDAALNLPSLASPLSLSPCSPGVETITVYEEILRQARYQLRHGAALYARKFRLSCSEMNGRYSSNEFIVEVPRGSLSLPGHLLFLARSRDALDSERCLMDRDFVALKIPSLMTGGGGRGGGNVR